MTLPARAAAALVLLTAVGGASAQYKVVGPDGSVTYTDRPPAQGKVTALSRSGGAAGSDPTLPADLRAVAQKYPVTIFTGAGCTPCDNGVKLLVQRGVPHTERRITSEDDALALEKASGARTVPALLIGSQQALRGFSEADWTAYLDAAGYPRESKLPKGLAAGTTAPKPVRAAETPAAATPTKPAAPEVPPPPSGGVRF